MKDIKSESYMKEAFDFMVLATNSVQANAKCH